MSWFINIGETFEPTRPDNVDRCVLCGESHPNLVTDEHVFPKWLIRRLLKNENKMTRPTGTTLRLDRFRVRLCVDCNTRKLSPYEIKVKKVFLRETGLPLVRHETLETWLLKLFTFAQIFENSKAPTHSNRSIGTVSDDIDVLDAINLRISLLEHLGLAGYRQPGILSSSIWMLDADLDPEFESSNCIFLSLKYRTIVVAFDGIVIAAILGDFQVFTMPPWIGDYIGDAHVDNVLELGLRLSFLVCKNPLNTSAQVTRYADGTKSLARRNVIAEIVRPELNEEYERFKLSSISTLQ